ncbi:MAG: hypothetical protein HY074_18380 [Deltaproteobacteria bacterium]|nr:hypothetical protein [Deltaproteobacteria bacterium]
MKKLIWLLLFSVTPAFAVPVKVAEAPFNDLALTVQAIETAQTYLLINIYELSSQDVADAIIGRISAGVHVELLEEGQPVGGMSKAGKNIQGRIAKAMEKAGNEDHFYVMTSKADPKNPVKRRFRFDHAKYIVADGARLLIGSENYSPTGNPEPGKIGNRGWEVLIGDSTVAANFQKVFRGDTDNSNDDVVDMMALSQTATQNRVLQPESLADVEELKRIAREMPTFDSPSIRPIFSPDTSLDGLLTLLDQAKSSIDVEQMTLDSMWGGPDTKSPLVASLVAAARRGVTVRVLLNDESVFERPGSKSRPKNEPTVDLLNKLGSDEGLNISARIADVKAMKVDYIHNKGALVDGKFTLVSSINWNENAVEKNRESAVIVEGTEIFSHYEAIFENDWKVSEDSK